MKLTEIEPIFESYVEVLNRNDLNKIIEKPLLPACQCLYDKNIQTLMTSANRFNVIGLEKVSENAKSHYSYGQHYAWLWIDYSSLSLKNKELVQSWYEQEKGKDQTNRLFLCTISSNPKSWDFDAFLIHNQIQLNTPCYSDSAFIIRYPVNEDTTVEEVQDYFLNLANAFYPQYEKHTGPRYAFRKLCNYFKPYLTQMNFNVEEIPFDPTFHSYDITIDGEGKYHSSHDATLERMVLLFSVLESNNMLNLQSLPENIQFIENGNNIKGLKRITFTIADKPYQFAISEKDEMLPNLQFGTSHDLERLKKDCDLLEQLSYLDWDEILQPSKDQVQYQLWKEKQS